jgi:cell division protein FtsQ
MPAVVRGGRNKSSRSAPKKTAKAYPGQVHPRSGAPAGKLRALGQVGLPPTIVGACVGLLLSAGALVVLMTGGRAHALAAGIGGVFDDRLADVGFELEKVHVEGASPQTLAAIKANLGLKRGQPIVGLDLAEVRARIERIGWVRRAKVLRLMPDTLVIAVDERLPLAVWQDAGKVAVVDTTGAVITGADPGRFTGLPLIVGEGADQDVAEVLQLVRQRPRLMGRIEAFVRVDGRRWDLRLKDGGLIQLPAERQESALIQLDQLDQRDRLLELGFARIDLRDPEMIAVRPRDGAPVAGTTGG